MKPAGANKMRGSSRSNQATASHPGRAGPGGPYQAYALQCSLAGDRISSEPPPLGELKLVFGELRAQRLAALLKALGAGTGAPVQRMVACTVAAAPHREGVLPAPHVSLELGAGFLQLGLQSHSGVLRVGHAG